MASKLRYQQPVTFRAAGPGYGYLTRDLPATFLRYTWRRAIIRVYLADGSGYRDIAVHPYNLTPRATTVEAPL